MPLRLARYWIGMDLKSPRLSALSSSLSGHSFSPLAQMVSNHLASRLIVDIDTYIPGYFFMGLGGPFLFISSMQLSNAFPRNSGQVLSILTGSFDASSCIFLLYRLAYYNGLKISPRDFFLSYLFFPVLSIAVQIWFMPRDSYKSEFEVRAEQAEQRAPEPTEHTALLSQSLSPQIHSHPAPAGAIESEIVEAYGSGRRGSVFTIQKDRRNTYDSAVEHHEVHYHVSNPVTGAMHGKKSWEQIYSPWWMYLPLHNVGLILTA